MNTNRIAQSLAFAAMVLSLSAIAETDVVTTIGVGPLNIDTDLQDRISFRDDLTAAGSVKNTRSSSVNSSAAEVGVTVVNEGFYMGFTTMLVGQSASDYSNHYVQVHPTLDADEMAANPETMSVTSYSGYLGKSLGDSLRIYGGYTTGKNNAGEEFFFEESGPFLGAQYVVPISGGALTLDLSYSLLSADIDLKDFGEQYFSAGNQDGYSISADAKGFSYSVTWLKSLDRGRSFFMRLKLVDLSIDNGSVAVTGEDNNAIGTATVEGSKQIMTLILGMGF
jgi:hypothetical protein